MLRTRLAFLFCIAWLGAAVLAVDAAAPLRAGARQDPAGPPALSARSAILIEALTGAVLAAEVKTPKPIVVKDKVTVKATVEAIDHTNRTVTLKDEWARIEKGGKK